jgi:hypothetical protein
VTQAGEQQKLIEELVNAAHDYTAKEQLETDAMPSATRPATTGRGGWRAHQDDLLMQHVGEKAVPGPRPRRKCQRYQSQPSGSADGTEVLELYLSALAAGIDPHTTYMPNTVDDFETLRLNLDGIGGCARRTARPSWKR